MYRFFNKIITYLGVGLIALGVLLFVIKQMSSDNPQNQPPANINQAQPKASNDKLLVTPTSIPLPFNAYFAVYTNNTFRLFDAARYHNLDEKVYIEPVSPNRITVTGKDATWGYFFNTLPMKLTSDCLTTGTGQTFCTKGDQRLRFFINDQESADALSTIIHPQDRLLVSFGNESDEELKSQFDRLNAIK